MSVANAWLLPLGGKHWAAVGGHQMVHLIYEPQFTAIPLTPPHCSHALVLEGRILPVWDIAVWLGAALPGRITHLAAIVSYEIGGTRQLGAVQLAAPPVRATVSDEAACPLPEAPARWKSIAISCFRHGEHVVPVVDLAHMFSDACSARRLP